MTREIKDKAIVISSKDKGESDRMLTLFSLENGKLFAKIRGVKKPKAKLAFASLPFCFGEYLFVESKGFLTVTNCNAIDNFFDISYDLNSYYVGNTILEIVNILSRQGEASTDLFVLTLRALKALAYSKPNMLLLLSKYIYDVLEVAGYKINTDPCVLKDNPNREIFFNFESGNFVCEQEEGFSVASISAEVAAGLLRLEGADYEKLGCEQPGTKTILRLLIIYFEDKTGEVLSCPKVFFEA